VYRHRCSFFSCFNVMTFTLLTLPRCVRPPLYQVAIDNSLRKRAPMEEVCEIDVDVFGIAKPQVVCLKLCESMRVCTDLRVRVTHTQVNEVPPVHTSGFRPQ
jgi:hypothetical protein